MDDLKKMLGSIDKRFDNVDNMFEKTDKRFDNVDNMFDKIDYRLDKMNEDLIALKGSVDDLRADWAEDRTRKSLRDRKRR
jgi:septation ring formation regulator EzrA